MMRYVVAMVMMLIVGSFVVVSPCWSISLACAENNETEWDPEDGDEEPGSENDDDEEIEST